MSTAKKVLAVNAVADASASENGATGHVSIDTLQGHFELCVAPEIGLQLARKIRHASAKAWFRQIEVGARDKLDAGPDDVARAQAALVDVDPDKPGQVCIHGLGVPFPPVIAIPVDELPVLVASAQQVLEDLGLEQIDPDAAAAQAQQEAGLRLAGAVLAPDSEHRVEIRMPHPDGQVQEQAMVIPVDAIDDLVDTLLEAKAEAIRRQGAPRRPN